MLSVPGSRSSWPHSPASRLAHRWCSESRLLAKKPDSRLCRGSGRFCSWAAKVLFEKESAGPRACRAQVEHLTPVRGAQWPCALVLLRVLSRVGKTKHEVDFQIFKSNQFSGALPGEYV